MAGIINEIKKIGNENLLGKYSTEAQLTMYEKTAIPVMTYNLECWTNLREKDWERLKKIQGKALKRILNMPESTPYWGLISEVGIWPVRYQVDYQKLMLLQNMITSDDQRIGKEIIIEQQKEREEKSWYGEMERTTEYYKINIDAVEDMTKEQWKKMVKEKIQKKAIETMREKNIK